MRRAGTIGAGLCIVMAVASSLPAQVVTRVDLDNDSFNFWQPPKKRADREYTQGTRVNLLWPTSNRLARRLLGGAQRCGSDIVARDCRMASIALAQAIYTPNLDLRVRSDDERPFAGWLGIEFGAQRDRAESLHELTFTLGFTGPASLAEPAQKTVHRVFRFRPPVGWDGQLPTELAFAASYRGTWNALHLRHQTSGMRLLLAPVWSARVGTLAIDASGGAQLVAGFHAPSPWSTAPNVRGDRWGLYARAGVSQALVARNLFLDGSTFADASARVSRNVSVRTTEVGLGFRIPVGLVEWRVHSRGREYRQQPRAHAYSTFSFAVR